MTKAARAIGSFSASKYCFNRVVSWFNTWHWDITSSTLHFHSLFYSFFFYFPLWKNSSVCLSMPSGKHEYYSPYKNKCDTSLDGFPYFVKYPQPGGDVYANSAQGLQTLNVIHSVVENHRCASLKCAAFISMSQWLACMPCASWMSIHLTSPASSPADSWNLANIWPPSSWKLTATDSIQALSVFLGSST